MNGKLTIIMLLVIVMVLVLYIIFQTTTSQINNTTTQPASTITTANITISPVQLNSKLCPRENPYKLPAEFERGISLLYQRIEENLEAPYVSENEKSTMQTLLKIRNCINVQFADLKLEKADGLFIFDTDSPIDNLKILVDNSYKEYDDVITAMLLSHEVTHAVQFVDYVQKNQTLDCIKKEVNAVKMELQFLRFTNDEEKKSINGRIMAEDEQVESALTNLNRQLTRTPVYSNLNQLFEINISSGSMCDTPMTGDFKTWQLNNAECRDRANDQIITKMVMDSPIYRQACGI